MNIKINKKEFEYIKKFLYKQYLIGSRMYGNYSEHSDYDYLLISTLNLTFSSQGLPNIHQFQYDDKQNNAQFNITTLEQFWVNQKSGDSTINTDVLLFSNHDLVKNDDIIKYCRTYKVIKAYLGFAKRDIKNIKGKNKIFHINRGLYCADMLLKNKLPKLDYIRELNKKPIITNKSDGFEYEKELRYELNKLYNQDNIPTYHFKDVNIKPEPKNSLIKKLLESNNIREFRY